MNPATAWAGKLRAACSEAGAAILALRAGAPGLQRKQDGSPVTDADRAASRILHQRLVALDAAVPVVCEEGAQDAGRAERFWLVDPLDGTREFAAGRPLFTVNVALVEGARAVFGVVLAPLDGRCWWGGPGLGAFRDEVPIRARTLPAGVPGPTILLSPGEARRSEGRVLQTLRRHYPAATVDAVPGAIKFCLLAEGAADLYPRGSPSCAWDSAAGQAILEGAGGAVYALDGKPLGYAATPGWRNGDFLAVADPNADWRGLLEELGR